MSRAQPDFGEIFGATFGPPAEPIRYTLRPEPNFWHDVVFLSSLIHDARVKNPGVLARNGVLTIELERDCWELGYTQKERSLELHIVDSALELRGVESVEWRLCLDGEREPWVDSLWAKRRRHLDLDGFFSVRLTGTDWWFVASLRERDWSVELSDRECPYLWTERYGPRDNVAPPQGIG